MQTGRARGLAGVLAAVLPAALTVACSGQAAPTAPSPSDRATPALPTSAAAPPTAGATDWLTYHGNAARSGNVAGLPAAGRLAVAWSARLGGAVYGQPLVIGDTVVAATESDEVYGLNRETGAVRWRTRVGTPLPLAQQPCGDIGPLGITGTGVYDQQDGLVYLVAQDGRTGHLLVGVRVSDGRIGFRRPVQSPDREPYYDQQRGALTLSGGRIYLVFGGHFGDCGPYRGSVVAVPATGRGAIVSYLVPTARQGGIWASAGPVVAADGTIYVSTGNGAQGSRRYDGSDSVTALDASLHRVGFFAPADWRTLSADDLDLGSMSPVLLPGQRILQVGKSGIGYLLNAGHLGGIGGQLAAAAVCAAFGGAASAADVAFVPCAAGGLAAVDVARDRIRVLWRGPPAAAGSPVVGGGAVFVADWTTGTLYELNESTGKVRWQVSLGGLLPHFASPSLSGNLLLVGTLTGVTAVTGA